RLSIGATATEPTPLSLPDALPISNRGGGSCAPPLLVPRHGVLALHGGTAAGPAGGAAAARRGLGTSARPPGGLVRPGGHIVQRLDRKSTRLNSSHVKISYAVFCSK